MAARARFVGGAFRPLLGEEETGKRKPEGDLGGRVGSVWVKASRKEEPVKKDPALNGRVSLRDPKERMSSSLGGSDSPLALSLIPTPSPEDESSVGSASLGDFWRAMKTAPRAFFSHKREERAQQPAAGLVLPDMGAFEVCCDISRGLKCDSVEAPLPYDDFRRALLNILTGKEITVAGEKKRIGEKIGSGNFSDVFHLEGGNVIKIPRDLDHVSTRKIQINQKNSERQYDELMGDAIQESLAALNLGVAPITFCKEGVIIQPYSASLTIGWKDEPTRKKMTLQEIQTNYPREWAALQTAKRAFAFFYENQLSVDLRPENLALDPADPTRFLIRDFYELGDDEEEARDFRSLVPDLLCHWALGCRAVYNFLDPRPKK